MEFPIYQVPEIGNGMTIGINAIIHVLISHGVAIGLLSMIYIAEYKGFKGHGKQWEKTARDLIKPSVIIITGVSAVTGVGIWFITSAFAPAGIGSMLRVFFWPWFIEWIVFTLEVIVLLFYYFTWDSWQGEKKKRHVQLGFWYVVLAFLSAFLITGILGFMLTSDGWPWHRNFFPAFFNPSFLPQLILRLGFAVAIGSTVAMAYISFSKYDNDFRSKALKMFGIITGVSLLVWILASVWYFSVVPSTFKTHAVYYFLTTFFSQQTSLLWVALGVTAIILILFIASGISGRYKAMKILFWPSIILIIAGVVQFERVREFIRGPYLMPGYMYANQVLLKEQPYYRDNGMLKNSWWFNHYSNRGKAHQKGAYLFYRNCSACHSINGINDIRDRVSGRSQYGIFVIVGNTNRMIPFMPPFSGSEKEQKLLSNFLYRLSESRANIKSPGRYNDIELKYYGGSHE